MINLNKANISSMFKSWDIYVKSNVGSLFLLSTSSWNLSLVKLFCFIWDQNELSTAPRLPKNYGFTFSLFFLHSHITGINVKLVDCFSLLWDGGGGNFTCHFYCVDNWIVNIWGSHSSSPYFNLHFKTYEFRFTQHRCLVSKSLLLTKKDLLVWLLRYK